MDENHTNVINEEVVYEIDDEGNRYKVVVRTVEKEVIKTIEKENKYIESLKKARATYQRKNKDKLSKQVAEWSKEKYKNDPEYREKIKQRQKEYYHRRKNQNQNQN
jgi:hypothetical protein